MLPHLLIDEMREITGTEPVIDIDDTHAGRAGVQHRQEGGESLKARAKKSNGERNADLVLKLVC